MFVLMCNTTMGYAYLKGLWSCFNNYKNSSPPCVLFHIGCECWSTIAYKSQAPTEHDPYVNGGNHKALVPHDSIIVDWLGIMSILPCFMFPSPSRYMSCGCVYVKPFLVY